jgi:hypothetical protein
MTGACLAFVALFVHAAAPDGKAWRQSFEDQTPGAIPAGWRYAWGERADDLLMISNLRSLSAHNSVLVDRSSGTNTDMWGAAVRLPEIRDQWAVVTIPFLVEGKGHDAWFNFDIRALKDSRVVRVNIRTLDIELASTAAAGRQVDQVSLGRLEPGTWHRLRLWLPTRDARQDSLVCALERREGNAWTAVNRVRLRAQPPAESYGELFVNLLIDKRGFDVYMDDLEFEQSAAAPDSPATGTNQARR